MKKTLYLRTKIPEAPRCFIERECLKNIFEKVGSNNIYVCGGVGCGKTAALMYFAQKSEKVIFIRATKFDDKDSILKIIAEAMGTDSFEDKAKGYTVVIDDIDKADRSALEILDLGIRFYISTTEYIEEIRLRFEEKGGICVFDDALRLSDDEVTRICGVSDKRILSEIGGYAAAAGFVASNRENGMDMARSYIYKNVFEVLENDRKRLVADTVLAGRVPFTLCEYLYGAEYGVRIAKGLKGGFFADFDDDGFSVHPLLKAAVIENVGLPKKIVNEKMLSYYEETEDYRNYIEYCFVLDRKDEAIRCLDLHGFEFIDKGEFGFIEKALKFIDGVYGDRYGIYALKGSIDILKGEYSGYGLAVKAFEHFREKADDVRLVYSAMFTARALRNTSYLKEALSVINEADKVRTNFSLLHRYFIDAEKISILNDMEEYTEAYNICIRGIEKCSVKGDARVRRLYERLSVSVYYFSKRLARAVYAYEKSKEFDSEDYWIKKRNEVYIYGLSALHIIGDRKKAAADFAAKKKELIESGITGELWYGEMHYLKIALYEELFGERTIESLNECMDFVGAYIDVLKNHNMYLRYFETAKELLNAAEKNESEHFDELPEMIGRLDFAASVEYICAYIKILVDRNDVDRIIPTVDSLISDVGGVLNVFFVNVVMDIALHCFKNKDRLKAEEYISWIGDNASNSGSIKDIDRDKLKVLIMLTENPEAEENLNRLYLRCALEGKSAYAEVFGSFGVWTSVDSKVKWRTTKTRDIMAYLVYMDGEGASKNRIIENVWGENPSKAFTPIFNTNMYNLRKAFSESGGEVVSFADNSYFIDKNGVGTELGYFKAAEKDFLGEKSCENALRILGWIKPEVMDGVEGVFVPILRSRCFEVAAEAFKVLNDGGYGYLFDGVIEKWKGQFGDSFLTEECRKIIEK